MCSHASAEVEQRLAIIEQRMHDLNYPEQKIQDVLGLAKLKILGDTIKAGSKGQPKPSAVLKAMQQWRQVSSGEGGRGRGRVRVDGVWWV